MSEALQRYYNKKTCHEGARDYEHDYSNPNFKIYEYNLSHCRSIARISNESSKQYFQGSSIIRKKRIEKRKTELQTESEAIIEKVFGVQSKQQIAALRKVNAIYQGKFMEVDENGEFKIKYETKDHSMSRRTKLKIQEKMMALYAASKDNFTMSTLTMIGDCEDKKAVTILNKYLTALKKKHGSFHYLWVAERQKNGRIHFHMIANRKFNIQYINSLWIVQQFNSGVDNAEARLKLELRHGCTFKKLHSTGEDGWKIAQQFLNPVDIVKVYTIDGVGAYVTKYVTKNETKMACQVWHCSRGVSRLFTKQIISKKVFGISCRKDVNRVKTKKGRVYVNKTFVHQYGCINTIYNKKYFNGHLKELNILNSWILKGEKITEGNKINFERYAEILYDFNGKKYSENQNVITDKRIKKITETKFINDLLINFKNLKN